MSRGPINNPSPSSEPILVKPGNDIYTVLVAVATVVAVAGLILTHLRVLELFGGWSTVVK